MEHEGLNDEEDIEEDIAMWEVEQDARDINIKTMPTSGHESGGLPPK